MTAFAIIGMFLVDFALKVINWLVKYFAGKFYSLSKLITYLGACYTLYYYFIQAVNALLRELSSLSKPDAVIVGFSYLPTNISDCLNILLGMEFACFIYLYKNRVYTFIYKAFKSLGGGIKD